MPARRASGAELSVVRRASLAGRAGIVRTCLAGRFEDALLGVCGSLGQRPFSTWPGVSPQEVGKGDEFWPTAIING